MQHQVLAPSSRVANTLVVYLAGDAPVIANPEEAEALKLQIEKVSWLLCFMI